MVALAAVSLLAVSAIGTLNSEMFDVDTVVVAGNSRTTAEDVATSSGIVAGQPLLDLDLAGAEQQIRRLPWIAEVDVDRRFSGQVVITVRERQPLLALPTDRGFMLVDEDGYQLERVVSRPEGFVAIEGIVSSGRAGDVAPQETMLVLNFLQGGSPPLMSKIDQLTVEQDQLILELAGGGRAVFGDSSQLGEKIQALETVLARVDLQCVLIIDLRVPSAAAVRRGEFAEGACI